MVCVVLPDQAGAVAFAIGLHAQSAFEFKLLYATQAGEVLLVQTQAGWCGDGRFARQAAASSQDGQQAQRQVGANRMHGLARLALGFEFAARGFEQFVIRVLTKCLI